jgi:hypothetical protein
MRLRILCLTMKSRLGTAPTSSPLGDASADTMHVRSQGRRTIPAHSEDRLCPEEATRLLSEELKRLIALDKWKRNLEEDDEDDYKLCHYSC